MVSFSMLLFIRLPSSHYSLLYTLFHLYIALIMAYSVTVLIFKWEQISNFLSKILLLSLINVLFLLLSLVYLLRYYDINPIIIANLIKFSISSIQTVMLYRYINNVENCKTFNDFTCDDLTLPLPVYTRYNSNFELPKYSIE